MFLRAREYACFRVRVLLFLRGYACRSTHVPTCVYVYDPVCDPVWDHHRMGKPSPTDNIAVGDSDQGSQFMRGPLPRQGAEFGV